MNKILLVAMAAASLAAGGAASADVITFDDVANFAAVSNGYHGLDWTNWTAIDGGSYQASGYVNGVVSPTTVACGCAADNGQTAETISSTTTFSLDSGYFTSAWNDGATLTVSGFVGGNQVNSLSTVLNTSGPSFVNFGWNAVDNVTFSIAGGTHNAGLNGSGNYFALDNLTVNQAGAVPEPATWAMMLVGFGGVGALLRSNRRSRGALATA